MMPVDVKRKHKMETNDLLCPLPFSHWVALQFLFLFLFLIPVPMDLYHLWDKRLSNTILIDKELYMMGGANQSTSIVYNWKKFWVWRVDLVCFPKTMPRPCWRWCWRESLYTLVSNAINFFSLIFFFPFDLNWTVKFWQISSSPKQNKTRAF